MPGSQKPKKKGTPHNCRDQFILNMVNPSIKNQTEAYQLAYNCSYETAKTNSSVLLSDTIVQQKINNVKKQVIEKSTINFKDQLENGITDHLEIVAALKDQLRDPNDPTKLNMSPRADEVIVNCRSGVSSFKMPLNELLDLTIGAGFREVLPYLVSLLAEIKHYNELDEFIEPLSSAIGTMERGTNIVVNSVQVTAMDNRKLLLDALKGGDSKLKMLGDFYGVFKQPETNPADLQGQTAHKTYLDLMAAGKTDDEALQMAVAIAAKFDSTITATDIVEYKGNVG